MAGHDISAGGLITTLLEMTFANVEGGMKINLHDIADADIIKTLFAENPGVVIQVSDAHKDELKAFFDENGIGYAKIGYPAPELRKIIIKKEGFEHEFDIDALRDDWYKTSYLLDRKQSMNGMAKKRYTNYKKQPIEMNFGYGFKGTLSKLWSRCQPPQSHLASRQPSSVRRVPMVSVRWLTQCISLAST